MSELKDWAVLLKLMFSKDSMHCFFFYTEFEDRENKKVTGKQCTLIFVCVP